MWACRAGVTSPAEGANVEVSALGHGAAGVIKVVADGSASVAHDWSAFFIYSVGKGEDDRRS